MSSQKASDDFGSDLDLQANDEDRPRWELLYQCEIFNLLYSSFEYGIGTQVMLSSTVFSPVREQLLKSAQNWLNEDEIEALKRRLQQVILYHILV